MYIYHLIHITLHDLYMHVCLDLWNPCQQYKNPAALSRKYTAFFNLSIIRRPTPITHLADPSSSKLLILHNLLKTCVDLNNTEVNFIFTASIQPVCEHWAGTSVLYNVFPANKQMKNWTACFVEFNYVPYLHRIGARNSPKQAKSEMIHVQKNCRFSLCLLIYHEVCLSCCETMRLN